MIASDGRRVNVGWSAHEILWLEAAIENGAHHSDLEDIAALSCRSYEAVKQMVYRIRTAQAQRNKRNPDVTSINPHPSARGDAHVAHCSTERNR
jgi:hypothetical protein